MNEYERVRNLATEWRPDRIVVNRAMLNDHQKELIEAALSRAGYKLDFAAGRMWVYEKKDKDDGKQTET